MRASELIARRPRLSAAVALIAAASALVSFQPLGSPWWTGYDFDSVYVASAITLFRGDHTRFYDHPGAPLQEGLAATFTAAWAVTHPRESRSARADAWLANLDSTRLYLRAWGVLVFIGSALLVFGTVAWLTRSEWWGFLAGLLFLGSPDLITWAAVVKTDPLLAALAVACVGLLVEGWRRRAGPLYLAAGFVFGLDMTVKVQAIGLLVPLGLAVAVRPPRPGWFAQLRVAASEQLRARRRLFAIAAAVWAGLVIVLSALSAPPEAKPLAELLAAVLTFAALAAAAWLVLRRTRAAALVSGSIGIAAAALAGATVPNLFYPSVPAPMLRQIALTVSGGGVNTGAHPSGSPLTTLHAWLPLIFVAAVGLAAALRAGDHAAVLWASGSLATGVLAYLRYGDIHYYTTSVALLVPLVVQAFALVPRRLWLVPAALTAILLIEPYRLGIDSARSRGEIAASTERVNEWVARRLGPREVALTRLEASDARFFHIVHFYAQEAPQPQYRFLPPDLDAARYVRSHGIRVRYVITGSPENVTALLASIGLRGRSHRVEAPGFVYRVSA